MTKFSVYLKNWNMWQVIWFAIFWSHFNLAEIWGKYFRVVLFYFFVLGVQFGTSLYTLGWLLHGFVSINRQSLGLHAGVISSYDDGHIIIWGSLCLHVGIIFGTRTLFTRQDQLVDYLLPMMMMGNKLIRWYNQPYLIIIMMIILWGWWRQWWSL